MDDAFTRLSALLLIVTTSASVTSGAQDSLALMAGLDSVDARVVATWDRSIFQPDSATTASRLQTVFELELRRNGVVVSSGAFAHLVLGLTVLDNDDGSVSYAYSLNLYEVGVPVRAIWKKQYSEWARSFLEQAYRVVTWQGPAGVAHVGKALLAESLEQRAREAAEAFANAFMASHRR